MSRTTSHQQIPINCAASDIQELFASGQTPVYELTEEKSLDELLAEFGWTDQRDAEGPGAERNDALLVNPRGDRSGAW